MSQTKEGYAEGFALVIYQLPSGEWKTLEFGDNARYATITDAHIAAALEVQNISEEEYPRDGYWIMAATRHVEKS